MTSDPFHRWPDLDALLEAALDTPPAERAAYLDAACRGDTALREVLERLLASEAEAGSFLEDPAEWLGDLAAGPETGEPDEPPDSMVGRRVGPYEVEERIGAGGMGVVYRASDSRLGRAVTLKFLRPWLVTDPTAKERFIHEARAASALDHPSICTIHDIGETDDGQVYICMAYYAGETLAERLKRGALPIEEALDIAQAVASGLGRAHGAGIVHRDLKPANVMLTDRAEVKLLDFGIAKLEGQDFTGTGARLGTVAYMSPEQATGQPVDRQTDVWALGALLYEMVTATRPFRGDNEQAVIHAILNESPVPVSTLRPDATSALDSVIAKALARTKAERYAGMEPLLSDLTALGTGAIPVAVATRPAVSRARVAVLAAAAVGLVGFGAWALNQNRAPDPDADAGAAAAATTAIAVMPFEVVGGDLTDWREGLAHLLSIAFDGAGGLRAIDSRTVFARWGSAATGETGDTRDAGLRIAAETGARYALVGSAVVLGTAARLVADIYDVETSDRLDQRQVEGHPDSLLVLVDRLSVEVLGSILRTGEGELPPVNIASITTTSIPALKAYLEGEVLYRRAEFVAAIEAYDRAIASDSTFALAHYHLASAWAWQMNIQDPNARRHREAALRHIDRLPEREAALVRARHATGEQRPDAVAMLEAAANRYPDDAEAWFLLGDANIHTAALTGPGEADLAFERAAALDPAFASYQPHGIELAFNLHADSALVASRLGQYASVAPGSPYDLAARFALSITFPPDGDRAAALAAVETFDLRLLPAVESHVKHPRFRDAREAVLRAMRDGQGPSPVWVVTSADMLAAQLLWIRGQTRLALAELEHPDVSTVTKVCLPAIARAWGFPIPLDLLERVLAIPSSDARGPVHFVLACQGYIAADLGRWDVHSARISEAEQNAQIARLDGQVDVAMRLDAAVEELRAYGLWRRGDAAGALTLFENARRTAWYLGDWPRRVHRKADWYPNVWPGFILQEIERPEEARAWFDRLWYNPLASYLKAQMDEELGDIAEAREGYGVFIEAWAEADPELQPWVEDARQAVAGLGIVGD